MFTDSLSLVLRLVPALSRSLCPAPPRTHTPTRTLLNSPRLLYPSRPKSSPSPSGVCISSAPCLENCPPDYPVTHRSLPLLQC